MQHEVRYAVQHVKCVDNQFMQKHAMNVLLENL